MLSKEDERPRLPGGGNLTTAYLNRIATAVPPHDMHRPFSPSPRACCPKARPAISFAAWFASRPSSTVTPSSSPSSPRMAPCRTQDALFVRGNFPSTARRMKAFEQFAPQLARSALDKLALTEAERQGITHVIVTSCTGLYAPGLDYEIVEISRAQPLGRTHLDRLHGLLRRHQRAQSRASHRSLRA